MTAFPPLALAVLMAPSAGNQLYGMVFMYAAIFLVFYLVLLRPQQRQRKQHEALMQALKKGDEVVTAGGIIGTVVHIRSANPVKDGATAPSSDDRVTIRSDESRLIVERGRITRVVGGAGTTGGPTA